MLLIHPPITKPCEPPAGLARIIGALKAHSIDFTLIDANIEGILFLMKSLKSCSDTWTKGSLKNLEANLVNVKNQLTYKNISRYTQVVTELNRVLNRASQNSDVHITLTDYHDKNLSPVKSIDLIRSAEAPQSNPFFPYFQERLLPLIEVKKPSLVGISLNYLSQALSAFAMIGFLKKIDPSIKIVLGGSLVTSWMKGRSWNNPFKGLVDDMVAGPGENWFISNFGRSESIKHYSPCYENFPMEKYFSPGFIIPYSTSNGCYWRKCSFCPEKTEKNSYSPLQNSEILNDVTLLKNGDTHILLHFLDNAISPRLLNLISNNFYQFPWYGFTRITDHLTDPDFCFALKRSGCVMLKLGLESGDQKILDDLGKGIDLGTVSVSLKNLKNAGIATYMYLLFGTTTETIHEARNTLQFIVKHKDYIDFLNIAIFNLPAYSSEAEMLKVSQFYDGDLSLYSNFEHPMGWGRAQVRQFLEGEFKREPSIANILKRTPPFFTSNHAPFFSL